MCGIAGIFYIDGRPIEPELLYEMSSTMKHRGPDSQAYAFFPLAEKKFVITEQVKNQLPFDCSLGFAHLRLAILDLSSKAHQPMPNENQSLWLIYNGEIYNYKELRTQLKAAGHKFRSKTDAEVILHAYEEWGMECLKRFNGMWAFALWDSTKGTLILSRDRFGIKPFYYIHINNMFVFASEIKAITKIFPWTCNPNYSTIYHFLATGLQDDSESTFFQDIVQFPQASCMKISSRGIKLWKYWELQESEKKNIDEEKAIEEFRYLLKDSVRLRLQSDVPIGTCLSGGLDSSSIVTLTSKITNNALYTFSAVYEGEAYDESCYIDLINKHCKTKPHRIEPKGQDLFDVLSAIIWHQDEPTSAPGVYTQWHVIEQASKKVKVLLDGQGGDEILGGYHGFFLPYIADYIRHSLSPKNWMDVVKLVGEMQTITSISAQRYVKLLLSLISPQIVQKIEKVIIKKESGINPDFPDFISIKNSSQTFKSPFKGKLNSWLCHSLLQTSLPALLHYEDRNSSAFSTEARTPLLDFRLVEFLFKLPFNYKIRNGVTKYILRKAMNGIVPDEILNRKDKKGFPTPVALWFRNELKEKTGDLLTSKSFKERGIFDQKKILSIFEKHCKGEMDYSWHIWRWINLEFWFREFIDKSSMKF
jgi:asparagine synthase (glutamine-hydrolysing)